MAVATDQGLASKRLTIPRLRWFIAALLLAASVKAISQWFPAREKGIAVGVSTMGGTLGAALAAPVVAVLALRFGWRMAFVVTGAAGLVLALIWVIVYRRPNEHRRLGDEERRMLTDAGVLDRQRIAQRAPTLRELFSLKPMWLMMAVRMATDPVWYFYLFWFAKYLQEKCGFTLGEIGKWLWVVFVAADLGCLFGGWASGWFIRRGSAPLMARLKVMTMAAAMLALSAAIPYAPGKIFPLILASLFCFAALVWITNCMTLPIDIFPSSAVGSVHGVIGTGGSLGGAYRREIPMIAYLMGSDVDRLAADAAKHAEQGFGTIKLKIGIDEENDIEIVRAVRAAVGPKVRIRADVNGAWTIGTAKRQLKKLEAYDLEYLEQPLPLEDLKGHAYLRTMTVTPIALDESAYTLQDVLSIIRHDAADVVLIDAHEAGGLLQARKAAAVCEAAGIPVTLHCGGELGISTAANLHLATTMPNLLSAIDSQYHNQTDDVIAEPFIYHNGAMSAPDAPGVGVELDPREIERYRTDNIPSPYLDPNNPGWFPTKPQY